MSENYSHGILLLRAGPMSLGVVERAARLFSDLDHFLDQMLDSSSIYAFLHRERAVLVRMATSPTCSI
jgi:hypothetical protein